MQLDVFENWNADDFTKKQVHCAHLLMHSDSNCLNLFFKSQLCQKLLMKTQILKDFHCQKKRNIKIKLKIYTKKTLCKQGNKQGKFFGFLKIFWMIWSNNIWVCVSSGLKQKLRNPPLHCAMYTMSLAISEIALLTSFQFYLLECQVLDLWKHYTILCPCVNWMLFWNMSQQPFSRHPVRPQDSDLL